MDTAIQNRQELEFAIFCIENIALKLNVPAKKVYRALSEKCDLLNNYIVANYDILHTQSKEYIVNDILQVMQEEGVNI